MSVSAAFTQAVAGDDLVLCRAMRVPVQKRGTNGYRVCQSIAPALVFVQHMHRCLKQRGYPVSLEACGARAADIGVYMLARTLVADALSPPPRTAAIFESHARLGLLARVMTISYGLYSSVDYSSANVHIKADGFAYVHAGDEITRITPEMLAALTTERAFIAASGGVPSVFISCVLGDCGRIATWQNRVAPALLDRLNLLGPDSQDNRARRWQHELRTACGGDLERIPQ